MRFRWDPAKEVENRRKHKIGFEFATDVFFDPLHALVFDRVEDGEERWHAIGRASDGTVLVVVHVVVEELEPVFRIISARRAAGHEREEYEDG